jgi:thiamine-monophosphate kinase
MADEENGAPAPLAPPALSEHGLIARYFAPLAKDFPGAYGLRDDAAVIEPPPGADLVVTMDALVTGVHFLTDDDPADIAWKSLAVNVSDLAAKGATPLAYSLALALPSPPSSTFLAGFATGLAQAQAAFGIALSGGDTTRARGDALTIAVTAFGAVPHGRTVRRGGARAGEALYVSGTIGDAALGLKLRRGDADALAWPMAEEARQWLVRRYLRPEPRTGLASALIAHASASMDVSDGLVVDCRRLCAASGLAATLDAAAVPLSPAASAAVGHAPDLLRTALTGGDDYEVLFSVRAGDEAAMERAAAAAGIAITRVGALITGAPALTVRDRHGAPLDLGAGGYDHFPG